MFIVFHVIFCSIIVFVTKYSSVIFYLSLSLPSIDRVIGNTKLPM